MSVFVSVGSERFPFNRLVEAVDTAASDVGGEETFIQLGHCTRVPRHCDWARMLPFDDLVQRMTAARVVVTHAGVGSILLALRAGKVPIVLPRRRRLGEHVDDHQVELAERLAGLGRVLLVESADAIPRLIADYDTHLREAMPALGSDGSELAEQLQRSIVKGGGAVIAPIARGQS